MGTYMKKQGIIFDMDGTLWDSAANVAESWNEAIRQDGDVYKRQGYAGLMQKSCSADKSTMYVDNIRQSSERMREDVYKRQVQS